MRIGLVGFFGWGNFGDELFYDLWHEFLVGHELVRMNDIIQKPYFLESATTNAETVDIILIGGGDLIRIENLSDLYWNYAWTKKPIIISGIGVAQESDRISGRVIPGLKKFLSLSNVLSFSVRDEQSAEWIETHLCSTIPIKTIPDLAFLSNTVRKYETNVLPKRKPKVALVLNKTDITDEDLSWWQRIQAGQEADLIEAQILVLGTGDQKEREMDKLRSMNLDRFATQFDSVEEMVKAIRQVDLMISAKFHAVVVASSYDIPYISIRKTSKSIAFESYKWSELPTPDLDFLFTNLKKSDYFREIDPAPSASYLRILVKKEIDKIIDIINKINVSP